MLRLQPGWDHRWVQPQGHFHIVSAVSVVSVALAAIAALAAHRLASYRALVLAMAFLGMSGLFAVHGLATPGFLLGREYGAVIGFAARMSVVVAAALLAASTVEPPARCAAFLVRHRTALLVGWGVCLLAFAGSALA
ncbi:MAG: hypothetical protein FJZ92_02035 [Chloroflexi bacterium]|nr:hypothetical protein [Chloroflexota bacterium]